MKGRQEGFFQAVEMVLYPVLVLLRIHAYGKAELTPKKHSFYGIDIEALKYIYISSSYMV